MEKEMSYNIIVPDGFSLLDRELKCVMACEGSPLSPGDDVASMLHEPPSLPLMCRYCGAVTIHGDFYCVRIFPLQNEEQCICEVLSGVDISALSASADCASKMIPALSAVKFSVNNMHHDIHLLKEYTSSDLGVANIIGSLENNLARITSLVSNGMELLSMRNIPTRKVLFDVSELCKKLVLRCNTVLSQCDRCLDYIESGEKLYVRADSRRAVVALVNAVQNALLYSPRDTVPLLAFYSHNDGNTKYVMIRLENENVMYTGSEAKPEEIDFCSQREGFGLPLIKCFAQLAGGSAQLDCTRQKTTLVLKLPMADISEAEGYRLENTLVAEYCDDIYEPIEYRMMEVVHLFNSGQ